MPVAVVLNTPNIAETGEIAKSMARLPVIEIFQIERLPVWRQSNGLANGIKSGIT